MRVALLALLHAGSLSRALSQQMALRLVTIQFAVAALLLPIATSTAVATWSELQSSAVDGANLQVTANVTFTTSITVSGTLVISGETGQEILNGDDSVRFFYVNSAGTLGMNLLTLKNGRSGVAERITSNGGGAVRIASNGIGNFTDCSFVSNTRISEGGHDGTPVPMGGAVYIESSGTGVFTRCRFDSNRAQGTGDYSNNRGGAVYIASSAVGTFTGCTFISNSASSGGYGMAGGAVYVYQGTASFAHSYFANNAISRCDTTHCRASSGCYCGGDDVANLDGTVTSQSSCPAGVGGSCTAADTLFCTVYSCNCYFPSSEPTPMPVPVPSALPTPTPTAVPTAAPFPVPTAVPLPVPTGVSLPAPTSVPIPTPTLVPILSPTPVEAQQCIDCGRRLTGRTLLFGYLNCC